MKRALILSVLGLFPYSLFAVDVSDRIEMGVSPIRSEITITPGELSTQDITFYNNSDTPYEIFLSVEDCESDSLVGTPICKSPPSSSISPVYFSTWVSFEGPTSFTVPANSERVVTVRISPPTNPIPGGRYGAVFFNSPSTGVDGNTVKMIRRIGSLFLITVPGQITYDADFGKIIIGPGGGGAGSPLGTIQDINLSAAPGTPKYWLEQVKNILDPTITPPTLPPEQEFGIDFKVPVKNKGTIHVLPVGRIELIDDNGLPLKAIGKEYIRSPEGAFVGERVVDYLPINDEGGNVLPSSDRLYTVPWRGFAYETYEGGKSVIKFLSPQKFYSQVQSDTANYLLPWEKYRLKSVEKVLIAKITIEYIGEGGIPVPYETEEQVKVQYYTLEKGMNYGAILIIGGILFLIWLLFFLRKDSRRIDTLEEEVGILEAEVDELEKARSLAKDLIAKKSQKPKTSKTTSLGPTPTTVKVSKPRKPKTQKKPEDTP